ncbi:hypothetical protein V5799_020845 [Amblyomma americanum]|uniref:Uncharacterized protein n=1 Tax=Amblyomma americanum TaxID=6943 RepID=A0AAQ4EST4_AMBAM
MPPSLGHRHGDSPRSKRKQTAPTTFREGCATTSNSQRDLLIVPWHIPEAQGCARMRSLPTVLETAALRSSMAHQPNENEDHQPRSSWGYLLASGGRLLDGQWMDAYDGTRGYHAEVISIPLLYGAPKSVLPFFQTLERHRGSAQNQPDATLHRTELAFPDDIDEHTGQHGHLVETGVDAGHHAIIIHTRRATVPAVDGLHHRSCEGDRVVLLILGYSASRLPPVVTSTVLEVPGELVSSAVNTIEDVEQLKVLLEDLAQDSAADVCPSALRVRIPAALRQPGLHTTEGAKELAILPQDLAQDAARVFGPTATLVTWLVPLRHLPSPTSEKTRKNLCTRGWLSATLPLVSQPF